MLLQANGLAYPSVSQLGIDQQKGLPAGLVGELLASPLVGRYSTLAKSGRLFTALATLTAPVIYSTAAGTGGPLLWNRPTSGVDAHLLGLGFSSNVVTTVAGGLGITGNSGQTVAPTATTAIDARGNCLIGGQNSGLDAYRVGTPAAAGAFFAPFAQFHTGALTVDTTGITWIDIGGAFVLPPGSWMSVAGSATLTTLQVAVMALWAELPS